MVERPLSTPAHNLREVPRSMLGFSNLFFFAQVLHQLEVPVLGSDVYHGFIVFTLPEVVSVPRVPWPRCPGWARA